ncbi:MAG: hypothetical protein ACRD50_08315 [Candidatus Acidiferrales bacterium]
MKSLSVAALVLFFAAIVFAQSGAPSSDAHPSAIGLAVGARAPAFSVRDQFGHEQSNETLRGRRGTILLFVRSADW